MMINSMRIFSITMMLLFGVCANTSGAFAADGDQASAQQSKTTAQEKKTSPENVDQRIDTLENALSRIERQKNAINELQKRVGKGEWIIVNATEARLDRAWLTLLNRNMAFVEAVAAEGEAGVEVENYRQQAIEILNSQPDVAAEAVKRIRARIEIPKPGLSAVEQAAGYTKVFTLLETMDQVDEVLIRNIELSKHFGMDVTRQETLLAENLSDRAANRSILLDMAMDDVTALRAAASAVPDDAEVNAKLTVATNHVVSLAEGLSAVLVVMESLGLDTADYQEQVLNATGQITTDIFEAGVITNLLVGWGQTLWNIVIEDGPNLVFNILLFLLIVLGFNKLAGFVRKLVERGLERSHLKLSELLRRMVVSMVGNIIVVLGVLIALSQVGISLGPLLAGLGVVGFIVGFALQDSLSNFAAGMLILIYRPFDVGDLIEAGEISGKVSHMSLVNTTVLTLDNQTIVVPNNKIWGDVVKNVTAQSRRRIDMVFGISYTDDIPHTERVLQEIVDTHEKVLADPKPIVRLNELADSSVNFVVRPWVKMDDYLEVYWDITRAVKMRFDEEGISIPFPQRDVHVFNQSQ
ncbi:mechanosensitive ion channel family protein [Pseudomonadota bacterium]